MCGHGSNAEAGAPADPLHKACHYCSAKCVYKRNPECKCCTTNAGGAGGPNGRQRRSGPKPQWWQRAFAKQLGPEYEESYKGALPRKRLSKQSWEKYVVG